MANRKISIFDNFLSGGKVGNNFLSSAKATLNASTLILSLVAWAVLYFCVALRLRRLSSRVKVPISLLFSLQSINIHNLKACLYAINYGVYWIWMYFDIYYLFTVCGDPRRYCTMWWSAEPLGSLCWSSWHLQ